MQFCAHDDFNLPGSGGRGGSRHAWSLVAGVGEDALDEREQAAGVSIEHQPGAIAVLDGGGMDGHAQQEAKRVDEDMALAARDLLGRVKALRIKRGAPF